MGWRDWLGLDFRPEAEPDGPQTIDVLRVTQTIREEAIQRAIAQRATLELIERRIAEAAERLGARVDREEVRLGERLVAIEARIQAVDTGMLHAFERVIVRTEDRLAGIEATLLRRIHEVRQAVQAAAEAGGDNLATLQGGLAGAISAAVRATDDLMKEAREDLRRAIAEEAACVIGIVHAEGDMGRHHLGETMKLAAPVLPPNATAPSDAARPAGLAIPLDCGHIGASYLTDRAGQTRCSETCPGLRHG